MMAARGEAKRVDTLLWVVTDTGGRIQQISSAAASTLGLASDCRGYDLIGLLEGHRRGAMLDMEIASIGWGSVRVAQFQRIAQQPIPMRYVVSRRPGTTPVLLHWTLSRIATPAARP